MKQNSLRDNYRIAGDIKVIEKPLINRDSINGTNNTRNDNSILIMENKPQGKSFANPVGLGNPGLANEQ